MAIDINFMVDQGSKFTGIITVTDDEGGAFDLTGYTLFSQMRKSYYSNTSYDLDVNIEGDPTNGEIKLTINPSLSNTIRSGRYVYDIEIHGVDVDDIKRVVQGIITLTPQVTRL